MFVSQIAPTNGQVWSHTFFNSNFLLHLFHLVGLIITSQHYILGIDQMQNCLNFLLHLFHLVGLIITSQHCILGHWPNAKLFELQITRKWLFFPSFFLFFIGTCALFKRSRNKAPFQWLMKRNPLRSMICLMIRNPLRSMICLMIRSSMGGK